jgi:hypothetical protein
MTGDTLITACVQAGSDIAARAIVAGAPQYAVWSAADLLYVDVSGHALAWVRRTVAAEARA